MRLFAVSGPFSVTSRERDLCRGRQRDGRGSEGADAVSQGSHHAEGLCVRQPLDRRVPFGSERGVTCLRQATVGPPSFGLRGENHRTSCLSAKNSRSATVHTVRADCRDRDPAVVLRTPTAAKA